jgi:hypothetical protein
VVTLSPGPPAPHVRRNRQTDLLGDFEIGNKSQFGRALDGEIGGLGGKENIWDLKEQKRLVETN